MDEPEPVEADEPIPPWEAQLARVMLIRPELAAALRRDGGLGPDEFTNATARRIYDAASTDPAGFTLRTLSGGDQRRAAGLLVREVPEFADEAEPEAIKQLMADCVRLIHEDSVRRALVSISTEMHRARDEGRTARRGRAGRQAEPPRRRRSAPPPHTRGPLIGPACLRAPMRACLIRGVASHHHPRACVDPSIRSPELAHSDGFDNYCEHCRCTNRPADLAERASACAA